MVLPLKAKKKKSEKILPASIFVLCLLFLSCRDRDSAKNYAVEYLDRNAAVSLDKKANPLLLVVTIDENGKLSLNKIGTGTIDDVSILSEKLKAIFDDRERTRIAEREVIIDAQGKVESEDLEKLIECLTKSDAAPIRVIKNDL